MASVFWDRQLLSAMINELWSWSTATAGYDCVCMASLSLS